MLFPLVCLGLAAANVVLAKHLPASEFDRIRSQHPNVRTLLLDPTCRHIQAAVSNVSAVWAPGTPEYGAQSSHWCASSALYSSCVVEPGSVADVQTIMLILANSTAPFAVRGGGHSCNPGFSSVSGGVLVAMARFNSVTYHNDTQVADIGPGLIWDEVYDALVSTYGRNVVGGRVSGVGVAGFTLGGGYSWLTNQYGLTSDTAVSFQIVTPDGVVREASSAQNPDLFFGLQGGGNNFGIVTRISLQTFAQGETWGGYTVLNGVELDALDVLIADWDANNTDPKAQILPTYNFLAGIAAPTVLLFYDAPTPPNGTFDKFLALQTVSKDVSTRSFSSLVRSSPTNATGGLRGTFSTVSLEKLSPGILKVIHSEAVRVSSTALLGGGIFISYDIEPFVPLAAQKARDAAWPHPKRLSPLNLYYAWPLGLSDGIFLTEVQKSRNIIRAAAIAEGQNLTDLYYYPNYALSSEPIQNVYGDNLAKLQQIAAKYDPSKVMLRTGGFHFQKK